MPHRPRDDTPNSWHHVMNRGIARRTVFESRRDVRRFLAALAKQVRRGGLEIHAYCVLTTHFHLLLRSAGGTLSTTVGRAVNEYVRYFNRGRRRDGSLFRGRFTSLVVDSDVYRRILVRYIDQNAPRAGLAETPAGYPYGSARHYSETSGPPWLARSWVEAEVVAASGRRTYDPSCYETAFGPALPAGTRRLVERRILSARHAPDDDLDQLLRAAPPEVADWMRRKALLADGTRPGQPVADPESVDAVLEQAKRTGEPWRVSARRNAATGFDLARAAFLHDLAAARDAETARRVGTSLQSIARRRLEHAQHVLANPTYAARCSRLVCRILRCCHGADVAAESRNE
jgi:hypothetical protein